MSAPVPRKPSLARVLARDQGRIRRLEVNGTRQNGSPGFPDFRGEGSPEGVVTARYGQWYEDTLTGNLWLFLGQAAPPPV